VQLDFGQQNARNKTNALTRMDLFSVVVMGSQKTQLTQ